MIESSLIGVDTLLDTLEGPFKPKGKSDIVIDMVSWIVMHASYESVSSTHTTIHTHDDNSGPQGGAFDKDIDYARTVVGSNSMVKGLECALVGMKQGGIRQVVVPYGPLSYPANDPSHEQVGPKPSTFSGQRALNFVLENPRVDRTMLFNVKVIRIDKPNGSGGFSRG